MRVLFFPREAYPTDRVRINVLFARELAGRGHRIDFVMQAESESTPAGRGSWGSQTLWLGPTDSRDGLYHRLRKHWLGLRHDLAMLRLIRREHYDLLLVSDKFLFACIALIVARRRRVPFVFWLTFPYPELDLEGARARTARYPLIARLRGAISSAALYRWILPRSAFVFVQSTRMQREVATRGIAQERMAPILTGFGIEQIPFRASRPLSSTPTIAYLGTLSLDRQLGVLLEMIAILAARGSGARLLLVGDAHRARDRVLLEEQARALGVTDRVEITGFLPQAQALERVVGSDIAVSPIVRSRIFDVGSPTKLIEYLALGIPVVANDHPEQREILRESRAGVCVPWKARHFARGVQWLLARSAAEREQMALRGRRWVEQHRTYAVIADAVEQRCLAIANQPSGSTST